VFKDADGEFPPAVIIFDGLADGGDVVILKFAHACAAVELDGEIPVGAVIGAAGVAAGAGGAPAGEAVADEAAADDVWPGGELIGERGEGDGHGPPK